jgi:hypothetical protein
MPKYEFKLGAYMDLLDKNELERALEKQTERLLADARGVKHFYFSAQGLISGGSVQIPGPVAGVTEAQLQQPTLGPMDGYIWAIQRITIDGLTSATDVITFYRSNVSANNHLYSVTMAPNESRHPGGHGSILRGGDTLVAVGSSLTTTGTLTLTGEAIEVPAEMIAKLVL